MDEKQQTAGAMPPADNLSDELHALAVRKLNANYPNVIEEVVYFRGETTIRVGKQMLVEVCTFLRDDSDLRYNFMKDLTAADFPERELRFDVIIQLYSLPYNQHLRIKAAVGEDDSVPSLTGLFKAALFQEKEAYDMFGIKFAGHDDLRRILLPVDWEGWPLRKDYPLEGYH